MYAIAMEHMWRSEDTKWVLRMELRSSGLEAARTFTL